MILLIAIIIFHITVSIITFEKFYDFTDRTDIKLLILISILPILNLKFLIDDINEDLEILAIFGKEGIDYGNKIN